MASEVSLDFLGPDLSESLSPDLKTALSAKWTALESELRDQRSEIEKERLDSEQKCFELERDLNGVRSKFEEKIREHEADSKELTSFRSLNIEYRQKISDLEANNTNLNIENGTLRRERDTIKGEKVDFENISEKRLKEIERKDSELESLKFQLNEANEAKCEALVKYEEVESKEISLDYQKKRMEEERIRLNHQNSSLMSELDNKNEEILSIKREHAKSVAENDAELAKLTENARYFDSKESVLQNEVNEARNKIDDLTKRLKEARDSEQRLEENYRQELIAQTNLAKLYKEQSDDGEEKNKELVKAIEELQRLLKKSSTRYGELETKLADKEQSFKQELLKRNDAIIALKKELGDSNELIKNFNNKGLTAEGIESLSPSAAAASRLLKSGMSLTQIYSQLVSVNEELICEKQETRRLNGYLDQVLAEMEQRAPLLKKQKDDYERAVAAVAGLTDQIENAREEADLRRREADEATRRFGGLSRENERLIQQTKDQGQQIAVLLREVEAGRSGIRENHPDVLMSPLSSGESVISDKLVSFRDVSELQARNAELLCVVRELSQKAEAAEASVIEEKTTELRDDLEEALKQVTELKEARVRQERLVENIIHQRDMYKASVEGNSSVSAGGSKSDSEVSSKLSKVEGVLKHVEKTFETYKIEKRENEKIILSQLETANKNLSDARFKIAKLTSQEEYNTERFRISQANSKSFQNQVNILEERNNKLNVMVGKHEASISSLRDQLISHQSKLSKAEIQLDRFKQENKALKSAEERFQQEREVFHRERKSSVLVSENLKQIQLHLSRSEDESKMRLVNANESLNKELSDLRSQVQKDTEEFREAVKSWEKTRSELRGRTDEAISKESEALQEAASARAESDELRKELKDTNEKLELAESRTPASPSVNSTSGAPPPTFSAKVRDLELLLNTSKNEVKSLKEQLNNARQASTQFKDIADSAEARLSETNSVTAVFKDEYERKLKESNELNTSLKERLETLRSTIQEGTSGEAELFKLKEELAEAKVKCQEALALKEDISSSLKEQVILAQETQTKYETELLHHASDLKILSDLKESISAEKNIQMKNEIAESTTRQELEELRQERDCNRNLLQTEIDSLKEQLNIVDSQNKVLHEQLSKVTSQIDDVNKSGAELSFNASFTEEDASNSGQLMQIVKYLRQEKEILKAKLDATSAELTRIDSQRSYLKTQLESANEELKAEIEANSASKMSTSKHYELVQKVGTLSAVMDSNRLLREEKEKFTEEISNLKNQLNETYSSLGPLKEKNKTLEESEASMKVEIQTLKGEATKWRQRSNQLTENTNKMNPEEFKKLQSEIAIHKKNALSNKSSMDNLNSSLAIAQSKLKSRSAEINKLTSDKTAAINKSNSLAHKVSELEANLKAVKTELDKAKVSTEVSSELEKLKETSSAKEQELTNQLRERSTQLSKLKIIGRDFKSKYETTSKELKEKTEELETVKAELTSLKETPSTSSERSTEKEEDLEKKLKTADEIIEATNNQIIKLEEKIEEFKKDKPLVKKVEDLEKELENLKTTSTVKEERAFGILKNAKLRIENLTKVRTSLEGEIEELKKGAPEDVLSLKTIYETRLTALRQEKDALLATANKEKESLAKKLEEFENQTTTPSSSAVSSVSTPSTSSDVQTLSVKPMSAPRKPSAVQATIQPTRQKASVRPMAVQRRGNASGSELPQVSVQPTIVSVVNPSTLNPTAPEFVSRAGSHSDTSSLEESTPTAMVTPRAQQEEPIPGPSTASVAPTPKRPREEETTVEQNKRLRLSDATVIQNPEEGEIVVIEEETEEEARGEEDEDQPQPREEESPRITGSEEEEMIVEEEEEEGILVLNEEDDDEDEEEEEERQIRVIETDEEIQNIQEEVSTIENIDEPGPCPPVDLFQIDRSTGSPVASSRFVFTPGTEPDSTEQVTDSATVEVDPPVVIEESENSAEIEDSETGNNEVTDPGDSVVSCESQESHQVENVEESDNTGEDSQPASGSGIRNTSDRRRISRNRIIWTESPSSDTVSTRGARARRSRPQSRRGL